MKKVTLLLLFTALLFSCNKNKITGSGNIISQERNASGFTGVVVNGATKAFITIDTGFSVTVKGYQNLLPYLETKVSNGILQVGFKNHTNVSNDNTEVYVTLPVLNYVQTNGNGGMAINGTVTGTSLLKAVINGSADISIEGGNVSEFDGNINGLGNISALNLQCSDADINISGKGNVEISVNSKLNVTISGNGNVYYMGAPVITTHITGNGQVTRK